MATYFKVLARDKVQSVLAARFAELAGWENTDGVHEESVLYDPPEPRTDSQVVPAHFGLVRDDGEMIRGVAMSVGNALLGPKLLRGESPLWEDDLIVTQFGVMVDRLRLGLCRVAAYVTGAEVLEAYRRATSLDVELDEELAGWDTAPFSSSRFNLFISALNSSVQKLVPDTPDEDELIDLNMKNAIKGMKTCGQVRDYVLKKIVAGRLPKAV